MRAFLLCTIFAVSAGGAYAAPPQCALPTAGGIQIADHQAQPSQAAAATAPPVGQQSPQPAVSIPAAVVPSALESVPFVRHVATAGAVCQTASKTDPHQLPKVTPFRLPSFGVRCASFGS